MWGAVGCGAWPGGGCEQVTQTGDGRTGPTLNRTRRVEAEAVADRLVLRGLARVVIELSWAGLHLYTS